jgi:hypothetical protein
MKSKWKFCSISRGYTAGSLLAAAFVLAPGVAAAQSVTGMILDSATDNRIVGASVTVYDGRRVVADLKTDSTGRFALPIAPKAAHLLQVSAFGYEPRTIRLRENMAPFTLRLAVTPLAVEGVEAVAERRDPHLDITGFYQRKRHEIGSFISLEQIEKRKPARACDLFQNMNGVRLVCNPSSTVCRVVSKRFTSLRTSACALSIYMDGVPYGRVNIDELVPVEDLLGVEVYAGSARVPAQYGGADSACGVILLWTRYKN